MEGGERKKTDLVLEWHFLVSKTTSIIEQRDRKGKYWEGASESICIYAYIRTNTDSLEADRNAERE